MPLIFDLRLDPYERAEEDSNLYNRWHQENQFVIALSLQPVMEFVASFKEFPPRQKPASFNVDQITEMIWNSVETND